MAGIQEPYLRYMDGFRRATVTFLVVTLIINFIVTCERSEAAVLATQKQSHQRSSSTRPYFVNKDETVLRRGVAGNSIELNCRARGKPRPLVTWFKDGAEISTVKRRFIAFRQKRWSLFIESANPNDDGNYTCVATNSVGSVEKSFDVKPWKTMGPLLKTCSLNTAQCFLFAPGYTKSILKSVCESLYWPNLMVVQRYYAIKPIIKNGQPKNVTTGIGSDVELQCEPDLFDSRNAPQITWLKHVMLNGIVGKYRDENGTITIDTIQKCSYHGTCSLYKNSVALVDDPTILHLRNVSLGDMGWYTCIVENEFGKSASSAFVQIYDHRLLRHGEKSQRNLYITAGVSLVSVIIIIPCAIIIGVLVFKFRQEKRQRKYTKQKFDQVYDWVKVVLIENPKNKPLLEPVVTIEKRKLLLDREKECLDNEYKLETFDHKWEIDRNAICITGTLGEGAFGKVVLAEVKFATTRRKAAVKTLKEGHGDAEMIDLVKEMEIMKAIGHHDNIVNLIGVCTQPVGQPLFLIMEFAENGNLKDFLILHRPPGSPLSQKSFRTLTDKKWETPITKEGPLKLKTLLSLAVDVAKAMEFLSSKKCIHRDLAARNVLVTKDICAKVADFGMARNIKSTDYYRKISSGRMPLKWMSPEAVFLRRSTTQSDVWSFGVLLWEIMTFGDTPHKNVDVDVFVARLEEGYRMEKPLSCPDNIYEVMYHCWNFHPEDRPAWDKLVGWLAKLYTETQPDLYLDLAPAHDVQLS